MKIGMLNRVDVMAVGSLSGTPHFMAKALAAQVGEVVSLGPDRSLLTRVIERSGGAINRIGYPVFGRRVAPAHHRILSHRLAGIYKSRIKESGCDVIYAPVASVEIAYLETDIPIVYHTDMNWANAVNYYPNFSSLFDFARIEGDRIDQAAIRQSAALIYPSEWAADTARDVYGVDAQKIHVLPYGANFEVSEIPVRELALQHSVVDGVTLLWMGVGWIRKGGPIAYECLMELLRRGVNARLIICGCVPPASFVHERVEVIPFLKKSDPEQREKLSQLFLNASFFLFPTLADATPIVLSEASAHGLPSLVRDTGGVGGAITEGKNGFLLPPEADGTLYASRIMELIADESVYQTLVRTSRDTYEEKLNWDAWGRAAKPIFEQVLRPGRS